MRKCYLLRAIGGALAMSAGLPVPAAAQGGVTYYHCHVANYHNSGGKNGGGRIIFYHSALFPGKKGMDMAAREVMTDAFLRYVEANYPAANKMMEKRCTWIDDKAQAEKIYSYQTTKSANERVVTTWRYGGR